MDQTLSFMKMHGLGNDFVIIDARSAPLRLSPSVVRGLGDRHFGVGFDQLALIEADEKADLALTFYNSDGSTSSACGNATRCVAEHEMKRLGRDTLSIRTAYGILSAKMQGAVASVNMGRPALMWQDVPLSHEMDTLHLDINGAPTATGMGNPHCSFFVDDAEAVALEEIGPRMEHHAFFPKKTNVQVASVMGENHLRVRVWERGVGVTLASGSSSCAVAVAAVRRGLTGPNVKIALDGGTLDIDWRDDGVWMAGATMHVFDGTLTAAFWDQLK